MASRKKRPVAVEPAPTPDPEPAAPEIAPCPRDPEGLRRWIEERTGITIADTAVCPGHHSPWEIFRAIHLDRPPVALVLGSRGSGKSFLSALDTHLTSRTDPDHGTRILGGSKAQSGQIYEALRAIATEHEGDDGATDAATIRKLRGEEALYANGSKVAILAASSRSVRGPHVPSLKLDEVDEIAVDIRESAMGMCMGRLKGKRRRKGEPDADEPPPVTASVVMTSTCHKRGGPMAQLIGRAEAGEFPLYTMCVFEVLERCPESRSGPRAADPGGQPVYANCGSCAIAEFCLDVPAGVEPKAKRSSGHYPIESLIQKQKTTGRATFEADYLCRLTPGDEAWFPTFDAARHVSVAAEVRPGLDVHLAIDSGVHTGAVFFQVIPASRADGAGDVVHVFADYYSHRIDAKVDAKAILGLIEAHCADHRVHATTDPAGRAGTAIGPSVLAEFADAGLHPRPWPLCKVLDSLATLESFVSPADDATRLLIHPRCERTIAAFGNYQRAKKDGQLLDRPKDPQHPAEDMIDALRGGLRAHYPDGRTTPRPPMRLVPGKRAI